MNSLEAAITERRGQLARITAELEQLEGAQALLGGYAIATVKPPPPVRKERAVRAEPVSSAEPKKKRGRATATHFPCGHPKTAEHIANYASGPKCRTCKNIQQRAWLAKKAGKADPASVTKAIAKAMERSKPLVADALKLGRSTTGALGLIGATNPVAAANAAKWQKQCQALDFDSGKRCSLMAPHPMPHSASGRTFTTALLPGDLPNRQREIDRRALSGAGE